MGISANQVAAITGLTMKKANNQTSPVFLPQNINILAEMNAANQSQSTTPFQITSASQAAVACGYGSPTHLIARQLFPQNGAACPIPVWIYPQLAATGAVAKIMSITPTGTATAPGTVYLMIDGVENVDGQGYAVQINAGDTPTSIAYKINNAINNVVGAPVIATQAAISGAITGSAVGVAGALYKVGDPFTVSGGSTTASGVVSAITADGNNLCVITIATVNGSGGAATVSVLSSGLSYAVGDVLNSGIGNSAGTGAVFTVSSVNGSGGVTGVTITTAGKNFTSGSQCNTTCVTGAPTAITITSQGAGYAVTSGTSYSATTAGSGSGTGLTINITAITNFSLASSTCTAKWAGLTSNEININIDLNGTNTGVTFAVTTVVPGAGTPYVTSALNTFGNQWKTIVINSYGLVPQTMGELESYNGIPDPNNPTGRYSAANWKPLLAFSGTTLDDPSAITSQRSTQVTIVPCTAALSLSLSFEVAAAYAYQIAGIFQNTPRLDIIGTQLTGISGPLAGNIPSMNDINFRQKMVLAGCSTAEYIGTTPSNGYYKVWDFVTTYAPTGELPPYYRYPRDLNIYFNYGYSFNAMQVNQWQGNTLVPDGALVDVENVITPGQAAADIAALNTSFERLAMLVNTTANNKTITVGINANNQNRLDVTNNKIQISGIARICDGQFTGGFFFGN